MASQPRHATAAPVRELETQIRRFHRGYRRRLRKFARGSSRLSELLYTFPGLAFALAAGKCSHAARAYAIKLVKEGRPLPEATAVLGLPLWLKRLPPEAFSEIPGTVPQCTEFARSVVNSIPGDPAATAMWLRWVLSGAECCDEAFALWLAKQDVYQLDDCGKAPILPLAAFAWFSRTEGGPASGFIARPWHKAMSLRTAVEETRVWLERVIFGYCQEGAIRDGHWKKTQNAAGYRFVPLITPEEFREEGEQMKNCVATYVSKAASGTCLIYSIRRDGKRAATMEIVSHSGNAVIAQLLAAGNTPAPEAVWHAARAWLSKQGRYPEEWSAKMHVIPHRWEAIWRPYWIARPCVKPRLAEPAMAALRSLRQDVSTLARLAKS